MTTYRPIKHSIQPLDEGSIISYQNIYRKSVNDKITCRDMIRSKTSIESLDELRGYIELLIEEKVVSISTILIGYDFVVEEDVFAVIINKKLIAGFINNKL